MVKVTYQLKDGHPLEESILQTQNSTLTKLKSGDNCYGLSHKIFRMITHQPKESHPPKEVSHHLQDGQLDLEFDSSTAKLIKLVVSLAQLVYPSVVNPAFLVLIYSIFGCVILKFSFSFFSECKHPE